jgi:hypothetical protein
MGHRVRVDPVAIVDAAQRAGKFHPRSRDRWIARVAAGGRTGGQAVAQLLAMAPGAPGPGAAAAGKPRPLTDDELDQLYQQLYPDAATARAETERITNETGRAAEKFNQAQQQFDNSLAASKAAAARQARAEADVRRASSDADLFDGLFGKEPG